MTRRFSKHRSFRPTACRPRAWCARSASNNRPCSFRKFDSLVRRSGGLEHPHDTPPYPFTRERTPPPSLLSGRAGVKIGSAAQLGGVTIPSSSFTNASFSQRPNAGWAAQPTSVRCARHLLRAPQAATPPTKVMKSRRCSGRDVRFIARPPRTEPYVRLSRIRLPPRVCDGKLPYAFQRL